MHSATRLLVHHAQINEANYRTALEKLARSLPEPARSSAHRSVDELAERSSANSRLLDQVAQAWFERRILHFDYLSLGSTSGKPRAQELEVYFFEISRTNLAAYVLGFERTWHQDVRIYKLDRMSNLRLATGPGTTYEIPPDFDPLDFLSGAWGIVVGKPVTVHLRFSAAVAAQLRELPPHNLEIAEPAADGTIDVKARA
ncbi:MAG TPA: WYL domain-containing protein, partial [Deinococcales bacterium]|nr:WYL domain-containing protein [Deinococcales bacterium]